MRYDMLKRIYQCKRCDLKMFEGDPEYCAEGPCPMERLSLWWTFWNYNGWATVLIGMLLAAFAIAVIL